MYSSLSSSALVKISSVLLTPASLLPEESTGTPSKMSISLARTGPGVSPAVKSNKSTEASLAIIFLVCLRLRSSCLRWSIFLKAIVGAFRTCLKAQLPVFLHSSLYLMKGHSFEAFLSPSSEMLRQPRSNEDVGGSAYQAVSPHQVLRCVQNSNHPALGTCLSSCKAGKPWTSSSLS